MKLKRGSTSVRRLIFIGDTTSTTGAGLTGLTYASSGLAAYYFAGDLSDEVVISLADATLGTFTSGGFKQVDATNMPGWYEVGIPNAALDGGNEVAIQYRGATNMVPVNIYIELDSFDYQTSTQPVNVTQIGGDTQSATDLKDFADAGYDPATNKVQGVVLVDTTTTNSDMRGTDGANTTAPDNAGIAAIQAKTDNLPSDPADHSIVIAATDAILTAVGTRATQTSVDDRPTNAQLATALGTADDAVLAAISGLPVPGDATAANQATILAAVGALENLSAGDVNAEMLDVLSVDAFAELSAPPAASSSLKDKLTWLFMWARNKSTESATERKLYADDTTTVVSTEGVTDAAGVFTKGEAS